MINKILVLTSCLFVLATANAQEFLHQSIDWADKPVWEALDSSYAEKQEVVLRHEVVIEFAYSEDYNDRLVEYFTIHRKIRVFGDDAIQANNKVYIGMSRALELVEARARVITPEGEVIDFDEDKILESEGGDGYGAHKYFAIDGAVKGADIEYTYTTIRIPNYDGSRFNIQGEFIKKDVDFTVASPDNLGFAFKSYNGFPEMEKDSTFEERNVYTAHVDSIGGMIDEDYSASERYLQYLIFKLDRNEATGKGNLVSYGEVSQSVFEMYYGDLDKADKKALNKIINESGAKKATDDEEKVRLVENFLKTSIGILDGAEPASVATIMKNGYTSARGMNYMMVSLLRLMEIKHEFVLTGDRYEDFFDEEFEHYGVLKNILIYFPKMKKYMAPDEESFRLGIVPSEWTDQKGLFIKEVKIGDISTGLGKVKYIKPLATELTQDNMDVTLKLDDMEEPVVEFKRELSGYSSVYFQGVYSLIPDDSRKELDESLIKFADKNGEVLEYEVSGATPEDVGVNPMVYTGSLKAASIMEKAGNKYLLNVGMLIGPQMEMYQEEERSTPIIHDHNMVYNRTIRFELPEGYKVDGLEKLNIEEKYPADSPTISFVSSYTQNGNLVEVTIKEQYDDMFFEKEEIDEFRRIINAAANFNKVVLRIVKK
jgi:hypothetical protein